MEPSEIEALKQDYADRARVLERRFKEAVSQAERFKEAWYKAQGAVQAVLRLEGMIKAETEEKEETSE